MSISDNVVYSNGKWGVTMANLVATVVGVIVLTVLADMMLPEGQTSKYIKLVTGIIVVYVMVSGVSTIFNQDWTETTFSVDATLIDQEYIDYIIQANASVYEQTCVSALTASGYEAEADVVCVHQDYIVAVQSVTINISETSISGTENNIDIVVQDIISVVANVLSIESSMVSVCLI